MRIRIQLFTLMGGPDFFRKVARGARYLLPNGPAVFDPDPAYADQDPDLASKIKTYPRGSRSAAL
jgi:hypothetical protein